MSFHMILIQRTPRPLGCATSLTVAGEAPFFCAERGAHGYPLPWRFAASAAFANEPNREKNAADCPAKSPESVRALTAATAPAFAVEAGRITEQIGRVGSMNWHGSGITRLFWRNSSPLKSSMSGNVTPGTLTAGALPALSCQMVKCATSDPPIPARIFKTDPLDAFGTNCAYRLDPPCSMVAKWNAAVFAMACIWSALTASVAGMAGKFFIVMNC